MIEAGSSYGSSGMKQRAWKEKVAGMERVRLVKHVYSKEVTGRRPRGRPRKAEWITSIRNPTHVKY